MFKEQTFEKCHFTYFVKVIISGCSTEMKRVSIFYV